MVAGSLPVGTRLGLSTVASGQKGLGTEAAMEESVAQLCGLCGL